MISEKEYRFKINVKLSLCVFFFFLLIKILFNYFFKNEDYREVFGLKVKCNFYLNKIYFYKIGICVGFFLKIKVSVLFLIFF